MKLRQLSKALRGETREAVPAAWELGWLRDARAVPVLAEALAGKDAAVALAAAAGTVILLIGIPWAEPAAAQAPATAAPQGQTAGVAFKNVTTSTLKAKIRKK